MASIRKEILIAARAEDVWDAVRDVGALHTRLVPGFVVDTTLEADARIVTFAHGMTLREPIVAIEEQQRRLVWSADDGQLTHYNGAAQVLRTAMDRRRWYGQRISCHTTWRRSSTA